MKYPVIVVGAGVSGLRAASLLLAKGIDCLVINHDRALLEEWLLSSLMTPIPNWANMIWGAHGSGQSTSPLLPGLSKNWDCTKSNSKKRWLPALDHTRTGMRTRLLDTQTVFIQRRCKSLIVTSTKPQPEEDAPSLRGAWKQNPVQVALHLQEQLTLLPTQTHGALAQRVGLSRGRVCQYLSLLKLPIEIVQFFVDPANNNAIMHVTEQSLHELRKVRSAQISDAFKGLLKAPDSV